MAHVPTMIGNALNAVAQLMETLAEIDSKFVKLADRECDDASNEVKKWFKKLAVCITSSCVPSLH